jgi:hypothetical protein
VSAVLDFPFQDPVGKDYRAEAHLLGDGIQKLYLARRAQHPQERYLMAFDYYKEQDIRAVQSALEYRIGGLFEFALIAQFDQQGVDARRDMECRDHWAMLEKVSEGDWLPRVLAGQPRSARGAVRMAVSVGAIVKRAVESGLLLTGVRPQYMWGRVQADGIEVTGLSGRGETFFKIVKPRSFTMPLFDRMYCAPEVLRREPADDRSLTFTVALLVAEWATGRYPFPDATVPGPMTSFHTGAHAPLALPPALESLVSRCLQPKVGGRPRLAELLDALRSIPTEEPARRL